MAIRYYDKAVLDKIKFWVKDPNLKILGPDESTRLFQLTADQNGDKPISLPLIALSRSNDIEILSTTKKALTYDGGHLNATPRKSEVLNAIPIKLSYQLDIYTKYFAEADEYLRNFIFNIINYPKIEIEINYNNAKVIHKSNLMLESSVSDNSSVPEKLINGQFTRMTLRFNIDDAYLFSIPFMDNWSIEYNTNDIKIEKEKIK